MECVFCKIVNKELPSEILYENEKMVAFKDINPKAPFHILIVPKRHIASVKEAKEEDKGLLGELILAAKEISKKNELLGYKIVINVGREGGQVVDHLHLHLLSGKMGELP